MGNDVTTIIFALLAVFVVWKLRSVLGTRTGNERSPADRFERDAGVGAPGQMGKVIRLPGAANDQTGRASEATADRWKGFAEPGSPVWAGLDAIAAADPTFEARPFVDGARSAYEMIITAFAAGDRKTLQGLLARDVLDSFVQAIAAREGRGETIETTFVSVDAAKIEEAQMRDRLAQITLRFGAKMLSVTRDAKGEVIDGTPDKVVDHFDLWTFAREVNARDPNWKLVGTQAGS